MKSRRIRPVIMMAAVLAMTASAMFFWAADTITAQVDRPDAPTGVSVTGGGDAGELDVSWDAHPDGAVDYRVKWAPSDEDFRTWTDTDWNAFPTDNSYTITGLDGGEDYKVQVRARFDSGPASLWSDVLTATATDGTSRPAAVTNVSVSGGDNSGELDVSWDAHPDGAEDHRVRWAPFDEDFRTWTDTDWNAFPTDNSYTITGLDGGEDYKVQVRARFEEGPASLWSDDLTATATAGQNTSRPAALTNVSVVAGDNPGELYVSWDAHPDGATDHRVSWAPADGEFKNVTNTDWNAFPVDNELTITGLWPGDSYKVRVRARFDGPNGLWSQAVTGTAAADDPGLKSDDKESPPVITRDHAPNRAFALDTTDSINCGANPCTKNETYSVSLTGGQKYVAEVWGSSHAEGGNAGKLGITAVESPNGTKLGSDLSGFAITLREPKVIFTASSVSGSHKVKVRIDGKEGTSTFRVVVYPHVAYDDCAADITTDCEVSLGTALSGEFEIDSLSRSDVDWFKVTLTSGQLYRITLRGDSTTHLAVSDPFLRGVYDDRGRQLHTDGSVYPHPNFGSTQGTADQNSGRGNTALTYFTPNSSGTYFIGAASAGGRRARAGHYVLEINTFDPNALANDDCHPGMNAAAFSAYSEAVFRQMYGQRLGIPNTQADYDAASVRTDGDMTTCVIAVGETRTGYIDHNGLLSNHSSGDMKVPGDRDWFEVTLTAGTRYRIKVETRNGGMSRPDLGGVYDSGGTRVRNGNGSSGSSSYSEVIEYEPTSGGTYYIEVVGTAASGPRNTGRYWLTLTELP